MQGDKITRFASQRSYNNGNSHVYSTIAGSYRETSSRESLDNILESETVMKKTCAALDEKDFLPEKGRVSELTKFFSSNCQSPAPSLGYKFSNKPCQTPIIRPFLTESALLKFSSTSDRQIYTAPRDENLLKSAGIIDPEPISLPVKFSTVQSDSNCHPDRPEITKVHSKVQTRVLIQTGSSTQSKTFTYQQEFPHPASHVDSSSHASARSGSRHTPDLAIDHLAIKMGLIESKGSLADRTHAVAPTCNGFPLSETAALHEAVTPASRSQAVAVVSQSNNNSSSSKFFRAHTRRLIRGMLRRISPHANRRSKSTSPSRNVYMAQVGVRRDPGLAPELSSIGTTSNSSRRCNARANTSKYNSESFLLDIHKDLDNKREPKKVSGALRRFLNNGMRLIHRSSRNEASGARSSNGSSSGLGPTPGHSLEDMTLLAPQDGALDDKAGTSLHYSTRSGGLSNEACGDNITTASQALASSTYSGSDGGPVTVLAPSGAPTVNAENDHSCGFSLDLHSPLKEDTPLLPTPYASPAYIGLAISAFGYSPAARSADPCSPVRSSARDEAFLSPEQTAVDAPVMPTSDSNVDEAANVRVDVNSGPTGGNDVFFREVSMSRGGGLLLPTRTTSAYFAADLEDAGCAMVKSDDSPSWKHVGKDDATTGAATSDVMSRSLYSQSISHKPQFSSSNANTGIQMRRKRSQTMEVKSTRSTCDEKAESRQRSSLIMMQVAKASPRCKGHSTSNWTVTDDVIYPPSPCNSLSRSLNNKRGLRFTWSAALPSPTTNKAAVKPFCDIFESLESTPSKQVVDLASQSPSAGNECANCSVSTNFANGSSLCAINESPVHNDHSKTQDSSDNGVEFGPDAATKSTAIAVEMQEEVFSTRNHDDEGASGDPVKDGNYFLWILKQVECQLSTKIAIIETDLATNKDQMDEEVDGQLRTVIGKANLLINDKFAQFRNLCEENIEQLRQAVPTPGSPNQNVAPPPPAPLFVTLSSDLEGFWEMVQLQVRDVERMISEVDRLRANGWKQLPLLIPEHNPVKSAATSRRNATNKSTKSSMNDPTKKKNDAAEASRIAESRKRLQAARREAMLKMREQTRQVAGDVGSTSETGELTVLVVK